MKEIRLHSETVDIFCIVLFPVFGALSLIVLQIVKKQKNNSYIFLEKWEICAEIY